MMIKITKSYILRLMQRIMIIIMFVLKENLEVSSKSKREHEGLD